MTFPNNNIISYKSFDVPAEVELEHTNTPLGAVCFTQSIVLPHTFITYNVRRFCRGKKVSASSLDNWLSSNELWKYDILASHGTKIWKWYLLQTRNYFKVNSEPLITSELQTS